ncbi:MAG: beta-ketoacyl synthase N-terminal-like domain-containing protein [Isosphaeraceae bacterium]
MTATENGSSQVFLLGVGACTAVGRTAAASASAVRAGVAAFGEHPFAIDKVGEPVVVARAPYLADDAEGADRLCQLTLPAAREALAGLSNGSRKLPSLAAIVGLPAPRPSRPVGLEDQLVQALGGLLTRVAERTAVETLPNGHASGLMALESGWRKIRSGGLDLCLIGGVDSYLDLDTLEWLEACEQLHGAGLENNAWGFIPGEGAGFCLLGSQEAAKRHDLEILGLVTAVAFAREKNLIKTESVCVGQALTEVFRQVLGAVRWPGGPQVDHVVCDMNGEPYRADEYGFTVSRTSERFVDAPDFLAPADCWGDVGAASGPLAISLAAAAAQKGYARGPSVLVWASSETGERAAALLHLDVQARG